MSYTDTYWVVWDSTCLNGQGEGLGENETRVTPSETESWMVRTEYRVLLDFDKSVKTVTGREDPHKADAWIRSVTALIRLNMWRLMWVCSILVQMSQVPQRIGSLDATLIAGRNLKSCSAQRSYVSYVCLISGVHYNVVSKDEMNTWWIIIRRKQNCLEICHCSLNKSKIMLFKAYTSKI